MIDDRVDLWLDCLMKGIPSYLVIGMGKSKRKKHVPFIWWLHEKGIRVGADPDTMYHPTIESAMAHMVADHVSGAIHAKAAALEQFSRDTGMWAVTRFSREMFQEWCPELGAFDSGSSIENQRSTYGLPKDRNAAQRAGKWHDKIPNSELWSTVPNAVARMMRVHQDEKHPWIIPRPLIFLSMERDQVVFLRTRAMRWNAND